MKTFEKVIRAVGTVLLVVGIVLMFIAAGQGDIEFFEWRIIAIEIRWSIISMAFGTFLVWLSDLMTL